MKDCCGQVIEVTKTLYIEDAFRVRGKLKSGVWITLLTLEQDARKVFARPFLPGYYAMKVESDVRMDVSVRSQTACDERLPCGTIVEVSDVKFDIQSQRVRGLASGGSTGLDFFDAGGCSWVTLVNMSPGEAMLHA